MSKLGQALDRPWTSYSIGIIHVNPKNISTSQSNSKLALTMSWDACSSNIIWEKNEILQIKTKFSINLFLFKLKPFFKIEIW
jgi:hypothetical protein